ncbi:MAG: HAMP domain-containing histidine kinase [Pseudomonadales bacterium]|nr:HAMP domain-containing histidine kinase [Pseudomonadales bacterium]
MIELIAKAVVKRRELMRNVRALQRRLRSVGHDIRSPLFGIIGLSEIALDNLKNNRTDELEDLVSGINDAGKAMLDLAEGILNTKERRRVAVDVSHISFDEFLTVGLLEEKLESLYEPQAQAKGIEFTIKSAREDLEQAFPRDKVMQILGNLISNSIKFTPEGGKVDIELDYEATGDREGLHAQVKDSGRGMTVEEINSLGKGGVESRQGTAGEHGFGYGIAMVQRLIGELRGTWDIQSTPGEGTQVNVYLPV